MFFFSPHGLLYQPSKNGKTTGYQRWAALFDGIIWPIIITQPKVFRCKVSKTSNLFGTPKIGWSFLQCICCIMYHYVVSPKSNNIIHYYHFIWIHGISFFFLNKSFVKLIIWLCRIFFTKWLASFWFVSDVAITTHMSLVDTMFIVFKVGICWYIKRYRYVYRYNLM